MRKNIFFAYLGLLFLAVACDKDNDPEVVDEAFLEVTTEIARDITAEGAQLRGILRSEGATKPEGFGFNYWVQGDVSTLKTVKAEYNASDKTFTAKISGLKSYTGYAYTAFAEDKVSKEEGDVLTVKTSVDPSVKKMQLGIGEPSYISFNKATITGELVSEGNSQQSTVSFYLWEKGTLDQERTIEAEKGEGTALKGDVINLKPGIEYAYTLVGANELGTVSSDTLTFTAKSVVYVDIDAKGEGDGTSWTDAYTSLKTAVESVPFGVKIWVAEGLYKEFGIPLKRGFDMYGGFSGTETELDQRDPKDHPTLVGREAMFEGNPADQLPIFVRKYGHKLDASIIDGFTFQYGAGTYGGVCDLTQGSPRFTDCVFKGNRSHHGGVMLIQASEARFTRCVFVENNAVTAGGAFRVYRNASVAFDECEFVGNNTKYGGALYLDLSVTIRNGIFRDNSASEDGNAIRVMNGACPVFVGDAFVFDNNTGKNDGPLGGPAAKKCDMPIF
ncbi:hypothetical protein FUAX_43690 (plasmid) [Fulvitalea axinellae]|uniref:Right handed beta helix domain-containing protein n=1 Tax=Fulvitalea axinellae TaxID=1182444 RepID=A0AAU9CVE7_9BACT|nr:hypothetical protein FUAX_43690 [Fulvitalea axinellae]